jgi:hypothetical protein
MKRKKVDPRAVGLALEGVIDSRPGPFDAEQLSRSYSIPAEEVVRVLKMKGKYHG